MEEQSLQIDDRTKFEEQGFLGPVRLLTAAECSELTRQLLKAPPPLDWPKGHAANSIAFAQLARDPRIVDRVVELIGENVMLWGASLVRRESGQVHHWHTDIETSIESPGTVSVWIGLENTTPKSSLFVLPGSHRYGSPIQQQSHEAMKARDEIKEEDILGWAKALGGEAAIVQPPVLDGEALFFDGRLWHGSSNENAGEPRLAVLLQYARPDAPIFVPDLDHLEYPFHLKESPRPPCIMVHGSTMSDANRLVAAPSVLKAGTTSWLEPLRLPLAQDSATGFKAHGIYAGATRCLAYMECHASVLSPGHRPHEPHLHPEEEVLVVIDGRAELELVGDGGRLERHPVEKGSFAYYPLGQAHTIENVSDEPVVYLMFKWSGGKANLDSSGIDVDGSSLLSTAVYEEPVRVTETTQGRDPGFTATHLFKGPTAHLTALQCHASRLDAGAGYEAHIDAYDVGIVLLEGALETLDSRVEAPAVIFYSAGEPHGMRNAGESPASYLVFEFHGIPGGREPVHLLSWFLRHIPRGIRSRVPGGIRRLLKQKLLGQ